MFCYLFLSFIKRDCSRIPCLEPYMLTQCAVSGVDLVISLIYIIMGTITIQQLLPFVLIQNIPFYAVKEIFRAIYNRNGEK